MLIGNIRIVDLYDAVAMPVRFDSASMFNNNEISMLWNKSPDGSTWHDRCLYQVKEINHRRTKEDVMKTTLRTIAAALLAATPAFAATGAEAEPHGILFYIFIGFGALIVVAQFVPGLMLLGGMIKGVLTNTAHEEFTAGSR